MNETARAARKEREDRHKRQLRNRDIVLYILVALFILTNSFHIFTIYSLSLKNQWRTDQAPTGHPYYVISRGYIGHDKKWRAFDDGRTIEVEAWSTQDMSR
jgi:hypothetical protein